MYSKPEFTPQEEEKSGQIIEIINFDRCTQHYYHILVLLDAIASSTAASNLSCWCLMLQELFKHTLSVPHVSHVTSDD